MSKLLEQINNSSKTTRVLSSFIDLIGGGTPKTTVKEYWNGDIPWLSVVDFNNGSRWVSDAEKKITNAGLENSSTRLLEKDDIIISARGTVGVLSQLARPMAFNQSCYGIRAKEGVDQNYLFYLLKASIPKLAQIVHGAVFDTITKDSFEQISVPIPDLPTQKKIAEILSAYDAKIENNNLIIKKLETTAQTLFDEWFVNFRFPGYEKVKFVDSEIEEIPEGWTVGKISDFGDVVCGKTPSKSQSEYFNGEFPFIKIPDMHGQMFILNTEDSLTQEGVNTQKNKLVPEGSICVSCIATVGLVSITTQNSQTNQQINTVVTKDKNFTEYLYFILTGRKADLQAIGSGGSTTLNVNSSVFSNLEVLIPEKRIIENFHLKISPFFNQTKQLLKENISLKESRDQLLAKLI